MRGRASRVNTSGNCTKMGEFSETDSIMGVPTEEFPETRKAFV
jgi:hypothetical protein